MPLPTKELQIAYQSNWLKKRRQEWVAANGPCKQCGSDQNLFVCNKDESNKITKGVWGWSEDRRKEELQKATVLCGGCFEDHKSELRRKPISHGTGYAYKKRGCRCDPCKANHAQKRKSQPSRAGKKSQYATGNAIQI